VHITFEKQPLLATALAALALLVAAVPVGWFLQGERGRADEMLANKVVARLTVIEDLTKTQGELDPKRYASALDDFTSVGEVYSLSDTFHRQPALVPHIAAARTAYQTAGRLWIAGDMSPTPALADVAGADEALSMFPGLGAYVEGRGSAARFKSTDDALNFLWTVGAKETDLAAAALRAEGYPAWGP
jgi:hypothetical protein